MPLVLTIRSRSIWLPRKRRKREPNLLSPKRWKRKKYKLVLFLSFSFLGNETYGYSYSFQISIFNFVVEKYIVSQRYVSALFDHSENVGRSKEMGFFFFSLSLRAKPSRLIKLFGPLEFYCSSLKENKFIGNKKKKSSLFALCSKIFFFF